MLKKQKPGWSPQRRKRRPNELSDGMAHWLDRRTRMSSLAVNSLLCRALASHLTASAEPCTNAVSSLDACLGQVFSTLRAGDCSRRAPSTCKSLDRRCSCIRNVHGRSGRYAKQGEACTGDPCCDTTRRNRQSCRSEEASSPSTFDRQSGAGNV